MSSACPRKVRLALGRVGAPQPLGWICRWRLRWAKDPLAVACPQPRPTRLLHEEPAHVLGTSSGFRVHGPQICRIKGLVVVAVVAAHRRTRAPSWIGGHVPVGSGRPDCDNNSTSYKSQVCAKPMPPGPGGTSLAKRARPEQTTRPRKFISSWTCMPIAQPRSVCARASNRRIPRASTRPRPNRCAEAWEA